VSPLSVSYQLDIQADVDRGAFGGRTRCLHEKASGRSVSRSCWVEWRNVNAN